MAKYDITYSCGHTETVQLYGKHADRERKAAWLAEHHVCSACLAADREAAKKAAAERAKANGMTEGSDKQMAWACDIIEQAANYITSGTCDHWIYDALADEADAQGISFLDLVDEIGTLSVEKKSELRHMIKEKVSDAVAAAFHRPAKWAIDNRNRIGELLAKDAAPAILKAIREKLSI